MDGSVQRAQFRNRVEGIGLDAERTTTVPGGCGGNRLRVPCRRCQQRGIYLEPQLRVGYSRWDGNRRTEANGTVVSTECQWPVRPRGPAPVRRDPLGNGTAEVQPYLTANWLHTRAESQIRMDDEIADARVPRSRGEFSGGASVKLPTASVPGAACRSGPAAITRPVRRWVSVTAGKPCA